MTARGRNPGPATGAAAAGPRAPSSRGSARRTRLMVANAAPLLFAAYLGMVDGGAPVRYVAAVTLLALAAWLFRRFGLDAAPLQWLVLVVPGMVAMYELGNTAARGAFLLLSMAPLVYEMLALSKRRFVVLVLGLLRGDVRRGSLQSDQRHDTPLVPARTKVDQLRALLEKTDWSDIAPGTKVTVSAGALQGQAPGAQPGRKRVARR